MKNKKEMKQFGRLSLSCWFIKKTLSLLLSWFIKNKTYSRDRYNKNKTSLWSHTWTTNSQDTKRQQLLTQHHRLTRYNKTSKRHWLHRLTRYTLVFWVCFLCHMSWRSLSLQKQQNKITNSYTKATKHKH